MSALPSTPLAYQSSTSMRMLAAQALSRAAGAPLITGNDVELLIDGRANFDAWLAAIRSACSTILFENYIFNDDELTAEFRAALIDRANDGVRVLVIRDWLGCLGQSRRSFWQPLIDAGGELRTFNPPNLGSPFGWLSRDHRKLLVVDASVGFLGGLCVSAKWLGDPSREISPWRDTGVAVRGPAVRDLAASFVDTWSSLGTALADDVLDAFNEIETAGEIDLRVIATVPNRAGIYRLDQLIASMARERLWLSDAYFVGIAPYVQALSSAARDGVDVRLLVPGSSDIPAIGGLSRGGYRPLLEAGVRVFEWNGSMLHAKTAVADGRWGRVGSSNLNVASWLGNCELDIAVENIDFANQLERQYETDLENATEIVLGDRRRVCHQQPRSRGATKGRGGSSSRAAAGALRLANSMGAAISNRRVLGPAESVSLGLGAIALGVTSIVAFLWPAVISWPLAVLALWISVILAARYVAARKKQIPPKKGD
ncbi:MAG TPA: phospholipase D-like domain-containing protein [Dokdonella sp.]|uniref:phospholipase D-like domain-containing protein n=1 Tax=Dokdonella sp. TaxID=2291710 RepID=UPI002D7F5F32|nr:phospholipase D-like domain-containing protein [Dokdonella sp.]HET9033824.1 phospholipase D-like domain-containing protein [Dokdonella sp.]